jgi:hypothetical protein
MGLDVTAVPAQSSSAALPPLVPTQDRRDGLGSTPRGDPLTAGASTGGATRYMLLPWVASGKISCLASVHAPSLGGEW